MIPFRPQAGASVFCRTDFTFQPVANLYFYDASGQIIPFHLSLRPADGIAVVNRRDAAGWRREIVRPYTADPAGGTVEIRFRSGAVVVLLDGKRLGRFDRFPRLDRWGRLFLRRGFPGLDHITYLGFEGGVAAESLSLRALVRGRTAQPGSGRPGPGRLSLTDRLELAVRLPADRQMGARLHLSAQEGGETLPLIPLEGTAGLCGAILPGWVWHDTAVDAPLWLRVRDAEGRPLQEDLLLTRKDLSAQITLIAQGDRLQMDDFTALQALEHARYSGILPDLAPEVQAALSQAAASFGLSDFLQAALPEGASHASLIPPALLPAQLPAQLIARLSPQTETAAEDALCRALSERLRADPAADAAAVLTDLLVARTAGLGNPGTMAGHHRTAHWLFLRLADPFCANNRFPALFAAAHAAGVSALRRTQDCWFNSSLVPFLWLEGRHSEISDLLVWLTVPRQGWLVTPTLAWTMQQVLSDPPAGVAAVPDKTREDILRAWIGFVTAQCSRYWGCGGSADLVAVSVRLMAHPGRLSDALYTEARAFVLRCHGLSPTFWQGLRAAAGAGPLADPLLETARQHFEDLAAAVAQPADHRPPEVPDAIGRALTFFRAQDCVDVTRARRILFGPAGVAQNPPTLQTLREAGLNPGDAALRHMAFPDSSLPALDPVLEAVGAAAVAAAYEDVPRAPHARLQDKLGRSLPPHLAAAHAGRAPDPVALTTLLEDMALLASGNSQYLGLGLALTLLEALAGQNPACDAAAERVLAWLAALAPAAIPAAELTRRDAAPAVVCALARLRDRQMPPASAVGRALALFQGARLPPTPVQNKLDQDPAIGNAISPLHDLLVVVFSCRPYLDSRLPALRAGWLAGLAAQGVPYVVVVGDAAPGLGGTRDGDVVCLEAPDDYEGLPQKTLAALRWVHDHTRFSRVLKIDDDCFLDVPGFLGGLSHLKFDYYGRPLTRIRGQMDRTWHMAKAQSARGRMELDKSPEPSVYADGGSGYVLSRRAMAALLQAADSAQGQRLIRVSFMEDKLVGDLLALSGIRVQGEDYRISVERRVGARGLTLPKWENGFRPFVGAGIRLCHLDGHLAQSEALIQSRAPQPRRGKIWPSLQGVKLGGQSNTLDLVSPESRLRKVAQADVAVVACVRNEMFMLPHFLAHYRGLGIGGFLIVDNGSDDGTLDMLLDQPDVALFSADTMYGQSHYGVAWQEALLAAFRAGRWSVVADADELLVWSDQTQSDLPAVLAGPDFADADAARVYMLDMYPKGDLSQAGLTGGDPFADVGYTDRVPFLTSSLARGPFGNAPTWTSGLRHRLIPGSRPELFVAQKIAVLRYQPWMRLTEGLHYVSETRLARREMLFGHFKYTAAFRAKAVAEVGRRQHFNDAEEYRKYLALLSEGRETIFDPALSVPWTDSDFVRHLLTTGRAPGL